MSLHDLTVEKNSLSSLETLILLLNFYSLSSEQLDYLIFRFVKSRVLENTKYFLVKKRESLFLVKKYPVLWVLQEFQINMVYILGTKWIHLHQIK